MNVPSRTNMPSLDHHWMPFTGNRAFKAAPRMLLSAQGMYYEDGDNRRILDGTAGLWCVNAGHARDEIADAVGGQLRTLDYAPSFQIGHPLAFTFAERLAAIAPPRLDRIFFTNSGSEAVETALKIALAYQRAIGQPGRTRLIGRERAYHGVNFGGISVGGMVNNRRAFGAMLGGVDHLRHTHDLERNAFSSGLPRHGVELADDLERLIALHGADTIAAVIVEPVAGATGVLLPPEGYLARLRDICTRNGILLIFDEVITGFGRIGAPFAAQRFGVTPDLICAAKGLTNGVIPMGAVLASRDVYDGLMVGPDNAIELFHGYTYSAHPVACAAGLATLDIYKREGLLTRAFEVEKVWADALQGLRECANVIDVRCLGLIAGIELAPDRDRPGANGAAVFARAFESGFLVRAAGDTVALSPPLVIGLNEIGELTEGLLAAIAPS